MQRRALLAGLASIVPLALASKLAGAAVIDRPAAPLNKTKDDWKRLLPGASYHVMFEDGTESPGSSALNHEKRKGTFVCAACNLPLFDSAHKFDSGTGWPSFWQPLDRGIERKADFLLLIPRTEYHCSRCGGHQGHVFDDGPKPTGERYCNNGVALQFVPEGEPLPALVT